MTIDWTDEERTALSNILLDGNRSEVDPFAVVAQVIEGRLRNSQMMAWEEGWVAGNDCGNAERLRTETGGALDARQKIKNPYGA